MSAWRAVMACSLLVAVSCGATHPSAARQAAERQFVSNVEETATDIARYKTPDQMINLGNAVCDGFRANASIQQIAGVLEQSGARNLPPEDLGAVISVAVKDLCPVYGGRLSPVHGS